MLCDEWEIYYNSGPTSFTNVDSDDEDFERVNVTHSMQRLGIKIIGYASLNSENHKIINIELSL